MVQAVAVSWQLGGWGGWGEGKRSGFFLKVAAAGGSTALRGADPSVVDVPEILQLPAVHVLGRGAPDSVHRQSADFPFVQQRRVPTVQTV